MMPALFEPADLAAYLHRGPIDEAAAAACQSVVSALIVAAAGQEPTTVPAAWRAVGLAVAARIYDNPTARQGETIGIYSTTYSQQGAQLTPTECAQVRAAVGVRGAFTIAPAIQTW